jgi:hypothetical protein
LHVPAGWGNLNLTLHPGWKQTKTGADTKDMIGYQQLAVPCCTAKMLMELLVLDDSLLFVDQHCKSGMKP